jgi:3-hydroxyacyl-[acyl-carrier-protein] dehydratase
MTEPRSLDADAIRALLPHRFPMLMVDHVEAVEPGKWARATKDVRADEPWVPGHFPGEPVMPGVLITEAFAQVAGIVALTANPANAGRAVYLVGLDKVRFRRPVRPGERLSIRVETLQVRRNMWRFSARATVGGERAAEAELLATIASDKPRPSQVSSDSSGV